MSYCRWSSFIHDKVPRDEYFSREPFEKIAEKYNDEVSDWYIFWHADSGEKKEDQMLAIWHLSNHTGLYYYPDVKEMYESDSWGELEKVMTQRDFMRICVKRWLDEIKQEYGEDQ